MSGRPVGRTNSDWYIETSAVLAALFEEGSPALEALRLGGRRVMSALTVAEAARVIVRRRALGDLHPDAEHAALRDLRSFERSCIVHPITEDILARVARPFPVEPTRTLDAIHLATLELLGEPYTTVVLTRDHRVRDNARAMGFAVA